jgi:CubicO group peptidase (beta-lactamase class C family)
MRNPKLPLNLVLMLLSLPIAASAQDSYLCKQLDRIRAEENMPAIGAGLIIPDPGYPANAAQPFRLILCASGVEKFGQPKKVTMSTLFPLGSISKPVTGLLIARVIANEKKKANPGLRWNTQLIQIFPEIATLPGSNRCYDQRTVADMMAHTASFPHVPRTEPSDQWASTGETTVQRRKRYVLAAVLDTPFWDYKATPPGPAGNCFDNQGQPRPQLQQWYNGGPIIPAHMAEIVTGRSWEDLMRRPGPTTQGPGLMIGFAPNLSVAPEPFAYWHDYSQNGIPAPQQNPGPAPTNGPAGNVYLTVPQMARFLTEFMDASKNHVNRQLPDDERPDLLTKHGLSNFNRLGWRINPLDTEAFGTTVARWSANKTLYHNGSNGAMYADVYIVPSENAGMFVSLNADGPYDANLQLVIPNRDDAKNKVFAELAALRLHYGDAVDIIQQQTKATVSINGVATRNASVITDGRLTTEWSAPRGTSSTTITLAYSDPVSIDRIVVIEDGGENIQRYELAYQDANDAWHIVAKNTQGKDLIFPHRIFNVPRPAQQIRKLGGSPLAQAKKIRLRILNSSSPPEIVEIAATNLQGRTHRPLWWRRGFAELAPKGPILDPGPRIPMDRVIKRNQ